MCGSAAARLRGLRVRIKPEAWMSVCCDCCVFSDRCLCMGLISRPEDFYEFLCVACDLETSIMARPWPTRSCWAKRGGGNTYKGKVSRTL